MLCNITQLTTKVVTFFFLMRQVYFSIGKRILSAPIVYSTSIRPLEIFLLYRIIYYLLYLDTSFIAGFLKGVITLRKLGYPESASIIYGIY